MPGTHDSGSQESELAALRERIDDLRTARRCFPDNALGTLDAALRELDLAHDWLRELYESEPSTERGAKAAQRERLVLRAALAQIPVAVFLLDQAGAVRRTSLYGAELFGGSPGYLTGKPFSLLIDLSHRAAFRSRLSAALRTGTPETFSVRIAQRGRRRDAELALARVHVAAEEDPLVAAVVLPLGSTVPHSSPSVDDVVEDEIVAAAARRVDLMSRTTRLLLDPEVHQAPATLNRIARLIAAEAADWVTIDLGGADGVRRAAVAARGDQRADETRPPETPPVAGTLPYEALTTGRSRLCTFIEDEGMLGEDESGRPVLASLDAGSMLCVPLRGEAGSGVLTLIRRTGRAGFSLADQGLFEEIADHIALGLDLDREVRHSTRVQQTLEVSLMPARLPAPPYAEVASFYRPGTDGVEVGGDFLDVFPSRHGWSAMLGDVCGKGTEAAALTATVRHGARALSITTDSPGETLAGLNQAMLAAPDITRFATVVVADLRPRGDRLRALLTGAGHPPAMVLRADGRLHHAVGGGLPLGLFDDARVRVEELLLRPGDTLLFYSDGLTDVLGADREPYGVDRLEDVVARCAGQDLGKLVQAIEDDVVSFLVPPARDDIALLAVRAYPDAA
ncbi:MAG: SpoIIE family protein phosphatase [Streptosporangiales bacterium]|nr:SpoIIE family protein phosphatase [Streptosporangiales bacterium]